MDQYLICPGRNNLYVIDKNNKSKEIHTYIKLGEDSAENIGRKKYWS